jgi:hypothetical protein
MTTTTKQSTAPLLLAGALAGRGWSRFSLITGIVYILGLVGLATGSGTAVVNLGFTVAVIVGWAWLTLLMVRTRTEEIR